MNNTIVEQLRKLCRSGVVTFTGFGAYEVPRNLFTITVRPQQTAFKPDRLLVMDRCANEDWFIHDIKIGHRSQLLAPDPIPASMFAAIGGGNAALDFEVAGVGIDVQLVVEYVGDAPEGAPFWATFIGTGYGPMRNVVPLSSHGNVLPSPRDAGKRFLLELDDEIYQFREHHQRLVDIAVITSRPVEELVTIEPRAVALHLFSTDAPRVVFWASDEKSDACVFEVGDTLRGGFESKCDLAGYKPDWLREERARNLLISRLTPDITL